eukprot:CAMPEP_0206803564 /NCGR_PEP_ID=MMETSP0975-20121206/3280_1 /ASSEMBLY_ACC=CAM_ASM_000399 /TAXON_ID=483370 /ORGANISM="non described non described, Strain CCMP2097" /LENGTH=197 /DNA_ID=CAMNT_0054345605 /DNA_START=378 /DNA_END=972 /DNA_ORIENTATION=+
MARPSDALVPTTDANTAEGTASRPWPYCAEESATTWPENDENSQHRTRWTLEFADGAMGLFKIAVLAAALLPHADGMALAVVTRRGVASVAAAGVGLLGSQTVVQPAFARSQAEMALKSTGGETDLKGLLGTFEQKLGDDAVSAAAKKADDAKPLTAKIADTFKKASEPSPSRPGPGSAVPRIKAPKKAKFIGDGTY